MVKTLKEMRLEYEQKEHEAKLLKYSYDRAEFEESVNRLRIRGYAHIGNFIKIVLRSDSEFKPRIIEGIFCGFDFSGVYGAKMVIRLLSHDRKSVLQEKRGIPISEIESFENLGLNTLRIVPNGKDKRMP